MSAAKPVLVDPTTLVTRRSMRQLLARIWVLLRPYRLRFFTFLSLVCVSALLAVAPAFIFRRVIDSAIPNRDVREAAKYALLALLVTAFSTLVSSIAQTLAYRLGADLVVDLRAMLFDKIQRLPIAYFKHVETGSLLSRINNDVTGAQNVVTSTASAIVSDVVTLLMALAAMWLLSPGVTLGIVALLFAVILPSRFVGNRARLLTKESLTHLSAMMVLSLERFNVGGATLVKLFGSYERELDRYRSSALELRRVVVKAGGLIIAFTALLGMLGSLGLAGVYFFGAQSAASGDITTGTVVALSALVLRAYGPVADLGGARVSLMQGVIAFEHVFDVSDASQTVEGGARVTQRRDGSTDHAVALRAVTFRYPSLDPELLRALGSTKRVESTAVDDRPVLSELTLECPRGTTTAIVGESGAGKSTLLQLVAGLYTPSEGEIFLFDSPVAGLSREELAELVGLVSQDTHMFNERIIDNLRFVSPDASYDDVRHACSLAGLDSFIQSLPDGYETPVGAHGARMSGGERQRLAIARVHLQNPRVLLLDEATSQLDARTESLVQEALYGALEGRTALVVAHRLSTVRDADSIVVMREGRAIERGPHAQLLAAGGEYAALYSHFSGNAASANHAD